jgi:hypothetical protein
MNKMSIYVRLGAVLLAVAAVDLARAADPLAAYPLNGQVIQRLHTFDNPEGTIFSADGRYVFVSNSADLGMPDKVSTGPTMPATSASSRCSRTAP